MVGAPGAFSERVEPPCSHRAPAAREHRFAESRPTSRCTEIERSAKNEEYGERYVEQHRTGERWRAPQRTHGHEDSKPDHHKAEDEGNPRAEHRLS
jgi:hypothetical protein